EVRFHRAFVCSAVTPARSRSYWMECSRRRVLQLAGNEDLACYPRLLETLSCCDGSVLAQVANCCYPGRLFTGLYFKGESMSRIATAVLTTIFFVMAGIAGPTWADPAPPVVDKKGLSDSDSRSPDSTPGVEAYLLRAYPAD